MAQTQGRISAKQIEQETGVTYKTAVVGIVEHSGKLEAMTVPSVKSKTILPNVDARVDKTATIHTDTLNVYNTLPAMGYRHQQVPRVEKIYILGNCHTNTIEGFCGMVKNGIRGV